MLTMLTMMTTMMIAFVLLTFVSQLCARTVEVDVTVPWSKYSTSVAVEIGEYLAEASSASDDPSLYWQYLDSLCSFAPLFDKTVSGNSSDGVFDEASRSTLRQNALDAAIRLLSPNSLPLLETMLNVGYYVPAVQFYDALSRRFESSCGKGEAFFVVYPGEKIVCEAANIADLVKASDPESSFSEFYASAETVGEPWDHVLLEASDVSTTSAVLYGNLGSSSFCTKYKAARDVSSLQDGSALKLSVRPHFFDVSQQDSQQLAGYGVFLDIKNMEYKNVDDSDSKESSSNARDHDGFNDDEEVLGVNFARLLKKNPTLSEEIVILRDSLIKRETASSESKDEMKVWKIKDLGLQTLQVIQSMSIKESSTEAMQKFQDIVQNFPKFAASVSSVKIKSTVRNDLTAWYSSQAANALPQNTVLVNGKRIELGGSTFNVFDLLKELKTEVQILDKLRGLKFPKQANDQIMQVANKVGNPVFEENSVEAAVGGPIIRIDVSKGGKYVVNFVNNLEKDPEYKSWPKQLQTLLYPSWNLHALSRNLYTIVAIVDVFSSTGANMLLELQMLHLQQFPVRCGFVLACENERGNFCRLFAHIREVKGIKFATEFAYAVARAVAESEEVSNELLLSLATEASSSISKSAGLSLKTILQSAERHIDFVSNTTAYLEARNLPMNSFSLNGIVAAGHSIQQSLMQLVSREQYILSHYVRTKLLAEKSKSIFNDIMGITQSYARYHPILDEQDPTYVDFAGVDGYGLLHELTYVNPKLSISTPVSDRSMLNAANNLILSIPTTASGFESALNALQWVHHQETPTEENFIRSTHIAILWKSVSDGQAGKSTCSVSDGDQDGSCSINTTQELLPVLLDSMVDALSVRHDSTSPALCDSFCTTALEKILNQIIVKRESVESIIGNLQELSFESDSESLRWEKMKASIATLIQSSLEINERKSRFEKRNRIFERILSRKGEQAAMNDVVAVFNGRKLIIPLKDNKPMHLLDLALIAQIEHSRIGMLLNPVAKDIFGDSSLSSTGDLFAEYLLRSIKIHQIASYCGYYNSMSPQRFDVQEVLQSAIYDQGLDISSMLYEVSPSHSEYLGMNNNINIQFIVDPLSLAGQRAASLIHMFCNQLQYSVTVILTPKPELTEFPLQSFYRFVSHPQPLYSAEHDDIQIGEQSIATFHNLPRQHVLTVRTDIPEPWNVQSMKASQDIDNLRCVGKICGDGISDTTKVGYSLKNLLVAGQCFQTTEAMKDLDRRGIPPNGLQLILSPIEHYLGKQGNTKGSDTLVMQNLGYYQLKAQPGLFLLSLADGRASDLFTIRNAEAFGGKLVVMKTFGDTIRRFTVVKRLGLEHVSLLDDTAISPSSSHEKSDGFWSSLKSSLFGSNSNPIETIEKDDELIHVFSLATGQLYERLLRIMMLSVSRQASKRVKFWLLENYLSPTFKEIVSKMSETYGFEVGYVTYKWPQWLTQQTQQQRIIWGYKILFLDVLFPLDVKRVIYIDADQVVRADIKELWDLDLQGMPYAYTPFCTSREETLGFQFWRHGYWKEHLQGRPYHISALYVVDLVNFRKQAVGDSLRAIYDQLSRDPNSLANLDQDLPNYAQHQVPIFSLPQNWLWCETWCSDGSKSKAKTIDLCNNPLHKESKLDMAKRIISGGLFNQSWVELDEEIKSFAQSQNFVIGQE